jgi:DNA-binding transcriptional ArsR family regulator
VARPAALKLLPDSVPVEMPDLPSSRPITTLAQFRAISDPMRSRILNVIQQRPATAKQLAGLLGSTPGAIGYHLKVLESAKLAQVVAKRVTNGIVAKYYARTARLFLFDLPPEVAGPKAVALDIVDTARNDLLRLEPTPDGPQGETSAFAYPRVRLSPGQIDRYAKRVNDLVQDLLNEPQEPDGQLYGLILGFFAVPAYELPAQV